MGFINFYNGKYEKGNSYQMWTLGRSLLKLGLFGLIYGSLGVLDVKKFDSLIKSVFKWFNTLFLGPSTLEKVYCGDSFLKSSNTDAFCWHLVQI